MYLDYFQLNLKPFSISPDPKFLWLGANHNNAYALLRYGILESRGFILLTGEPGTGKSTLLNAIIAAFGKKVLFAKITDPALEDMEFFSMAADAFEMRSSFQGKAQFLDELRNHIMKIGYKKAFLVIDEAQRMTQDMVEQMCGLFNANIRGHRLLSCIFAGQPEFLDAIKQNSKLDQRIFFKHIIQPMSPSDTALYISHRLDIAGRQAPLFTSDAIQEIFILSNGNPRQINILCDRALFSAYTAKKQMIGPDIIKQAAQDTLIPSINHGSITPLIRAEGSLFPEESEAGHFKEKPLSIKSGKNTRTRKIAYLFAIAFPMLAGLGMYSLLNSGFKMDWQGSSKDFGPAMSSVQPIGTNSGSGSSGQPQQIISQLRRQKEDAQKQLANLRVQLDKAAKEHAVALKQIELKDAALTELKNMENTGLEKSKSLQGDLESIKERNNDQTEKLKRSQERIAQLEATLSERESQLLQLEQTSSTLEKALAEIQGVKARMDAQLTSREAAYIELQKRIENLDANQSILENELHETRDQNEQLQSRIKELATMQLLSKTPAETNTDNSKAPAQTEITNRDPDPASIIDYLIHKKSQ